MRKTVSAFIVAIALAVLCSSITARAQAQITEVGKVTEAQVRSYHGVGAGS